MGNEKAQYENDIRRHKNEIGSIEAKIKELETQNSNLEKNIEKQESEKRDLDTKYTSLKHVKETLEHSKSSLISTKNQKDHEVEELKTENTKRDTEIASEKKKNSYFTWGAVGSGVVHLITVIDVFSSHSKLSAAQEQTALEENRNRDLKHRLINLNNSIIVEEKRIKDVSDLIIQVIENTKHCHDSIELDKKMLQECQANAAKLHDMTKVLPELGFAVASMGILSKFSNLTKTQITLIYNSTKLGFHRTTFYEAIYKGRDNLVIIKSSSGYTFGGYLTEPWDENQSTIKDNNAFTFSTNRNAPCKIKHDAIAVTNNPEYLLEFGEGEIAVKPSDSTTAYGVVNSGKQFDCQTTNFYADTIELEITELYVYRISYVEAY